MEAELEAGSGYSSSSVLVERLYLFVRPFSVMLLQTGPLKTWPTAEEEAMACDI